MSAPAQNARPDPVNTKAPMAGSALPASMASVSSRLIRRVQAFSFSGRFRVISRINPRSSTSIC